jgi:small subunit ribosomal protein S7
MRKKVVQKHELRPDPYYANTKVEKLTNYLMYDGKKSTARRVVYSALDTVQHDTGADPQEVLETALKNVGPQMEVRSRRVGGANYQVPMEVAPNRKLSLALRWILNAARAKKGQPMARCLAEELIAAYNNEGDAVAKREQVHKMAEANRAFAHFAW